MAKTATINTRIDPKTKKAAEAVFAKLGLSTSDAVNMFFKRVSLDKGIPFDLRIPNKETRKALKEARENKNLKTYASTEEMFKNLLK